MRRANDDACPTLRVAAYRPDGTRASTSSSSACPPNRVGGAGGPGLTGGGPQASRVRRRATSPSGPHGIIRLLTYPVEIHAPATSLDPLDHRLQGHVRYGGRCPLNGDEGRGCATPIVAVTAGTVAGFLPTVSVAPPRRRLPAAAPAPDAKLRPAPPPGASSSRRTHITTARRPSDLASWDGPCAGQGVGPGSNRCEFTLGSTDTCITATWRKSTTYPHNPPTDGFSVSGPACPTGALTP